MANRIVEKELNCFLEPDIIQYYNVFINNSQIVATVTSIPKHVDWWVLEIVEKEPCRRIIGLDFKFNLNPNPNPVLNNAILVLCFEIDCLIYTLSNASQLPESLLQFFSNDNHIFVGIAIEDKLRQLQQLFGFGGHMLFEDLGVLAAATHNRRDTGRGRRRVELNMRGGRRGEWNVRTASLDELNMFLRDSAVTRPQPPEDGIRWDMSNMSLHHVHNACIDAYTCYDLGIYLTHRSETVFGGRIGRFIEW